MWWHDGMGWADWVAMALMMVGVWLLVVSAAVAILRSGRDVEGAGPEQGRERPTSASIDTSRRTSE